MKTFVTCFFTIIAAIICSASAQDVAQVAIDDTARGADNCLCGADELYGLGTECQCRNSFVLCPRQIPFLGCHCLPGYVRAHSNGPCIPKKYCAIVCPDRMLTIAPEPIFTIDPVEPGVNIITPDIIIVPVETPISSADPEVAA